MKQVIFLSTVLSFFLLFINNQEVLAARQKREAETVYVAPQSSDPRLPPEKYCNYGECHPTIRPALKNDAQRDAKDLKKNLKGWLGTYKKNVIKMVTSRGIVQRLEISEAYSRAGYGDVLVDLNKKLKGKFKDSILALMTPLPAFLAKELNDALTGASTDQQILVEVLCTVSNHGVTSIASLYKDMFRNTLESDLSGNTSGVFRKMMLAFLQGKRNEEKAEVKGADVKADAEKLFKAGPKRWVEPELINIFSTRSIPHLKQILIEYKSVAGQSIEDHVKKEYPGYSSDGLLRIIRCITSKTEFFASQLDESLKIGGNGRPIKDRTVIRILVSRSEIDLKDIITTYGSVFKKSLESELSRTLGGDYQDTLVGLVKGNIV